MRKRIVSMLTCPFSGDPLEAFGSLVRRDGQTLVGLTQVELQDEDELLEGALFTAHGGRVYPIRFGVASILPDAATNPDILRDVISHSRGQWPRELADAAETVVQRQSEAQAAADGQRIRSEMTYYDRELASDEARNAMVRDIRDRDLPHIFHPRSKYVLGPLAEDIAGKTLVEVGCGNARTVARLLPPLEFDYTYIGCDISFERLRVASGACPQGEFVQCDAQHLPLRPASVDVALAFGALHHMPDPEACLAALSTVLRERSTIAIHEPIATAKLLEGRLKPLQRLTLSYEHSDHDDEIDLDRVVGALHANGFSVAKQVLMNSPFRSLVELPMVKAWPGLGHSPSFYALLRLIDSATIPTVCRLGGALKPRGAIVVAVR